MQSAGPPFFDKLFLDYYPPLTSFAFRFVKDLDAAKDIVQSVFVSIYEKETMLAVDKNIKAYLYRSVSNACINYLKKESTRLGHHQEYGKMLVESVFEDAVEQTEEEFKIYSAIKKLPSQCQKIFVMSRFDNRKNHEIADELSISIRTVETQISNALKTLRKTILSIFL
jgi:RNA polymerase sigma-70 factor (family 1)